MEDSKLTRVDLEIFGMVQGVFFRAHTRDKAKSIGVRGWCRNTRNGTVEGQLEGNVDTVEAMKDWLYAVGSPSSIIDQAVFKNESEIQEYSFTGFSIKH